MKLSEYLDREISGCERRARLLHVQQKIDIGYVNSAEADPNEVEYYKCQVDLHALEQEYLRKRLMSLRKWAEVAAGSNFVGLVPPGEAS